MSSATISRPAVAETFSVVDLVEAALAGKIRIPEFQRPMRWQWLDVQRLFDSIVNGYPIGSLLLWTRKASKEKIRLGNLSIDAPALQEAWWVVDGQQRLTSLVNALTEEGAKDERFKLAYDLGEKKFVRPTGTDEGDIIPLATLFDLQKLIRWFTKDHPEVAEKLDEASRVTRAIREYRVPGYRVDRDDEKVLRDIFDRMNNYGKRLSRAEVFSALHAGSGSESSSPFQRIAESIEAERRFGIIDDDAVLHAVLARRGGDVTRDIRVEFSGKARKRDFADETEGDAYREGGAALSRAVEFLQEEVGIPHFAFLTYRYLLVVLTRFFAHFPDPQPRNRILLRRWYWRAAMTGPGPFSSSWTIAMRQLGERIVRDDEAASVQALLKKPIQDDLRLPRLTGFRTSSAESRLIMSALWERRPRSPLTGLPYDRDQLADAIGPDGTLADVAQRIFSREPSEHRASAANRMFILERELPKPLNSLVVEPEPAVRENYADFLASHALDDETVKALATNDRTAALERRQETVHRVVKDFLATRTECDIEDTPSLDEFDLDDMNDERDDALA